MKNNKFYVVVLYSFNEDIPLYEFDTKKEAKDFIKKETQKKLDFEISNNKKVDKDIFYNAREDGEIVTITDMYGDEPDGETIWKLICGAEIKR